MPDLADPFARAALAIDLLCVDPGLGGLHLAARAGPVRDRLTARLGRLGPLTRLHPAMTDEALLGGLDVAATLSSGRKVARPGLLAAPAALVLPMAERATRAFAARIGACLDEGRGHVLIALDEGAGEDEALPPALAERLAFSADLAAVAIGAVPELPGEPEHDRAAARARLRQIALPDGLAQQIAELTLAFGIHSPRAALFALRAARAHAALTGGAIRPGMWRPPSP